VKNLRNGIILGTIALLLAYARADALDSHLALTNAALVVSVNTSNATLSVLDRRTGRLWTQRASKAEVAVTEARLASNQIDLELRHVPSGLALNARIVLEAAEPEFTLALLEQAPCPARCVILIPSPARRRIGWWCR